MISKADDSLVDLIFVIEGTAINGAYINDLKTNYIIPTLEHFAQGSLDDRDIYTSDKTSNLYGIVVFKTAQSIPSCTTYGPFSSPQKVATTIDKLK